VLRAPTHRLEVPVAIAIAERHVFVLNKAGPDPRAQRVDGQLVKVLGGPRYHFIHTAGMVSVRDDIWTANGGGKGTLTEISASTGRVLRVVAAGKGRLSTPVAITTDGTYLWVGNRAGNHLSELSAASGRFVRTLRIRDASLDAVTSISVCQSSRVGGPDGLADLGHWRQLEDWPAGALRHAQVRFPGCVLRRTPHLGRRPHRESAERGRCTEWRGGPGHLQLAATGSLTSEVVSVAPEVRACRRW